LPAGYFFIFSPAPMGGDRAEARHSFSLKEHNALYLMYLKQINYQHINLLEILLFYFYL